MTRNNTFKKIGIIAAMQMEIDGIKERTDAPETVTYSGVDFVCGNIGDKYVVCAKCGIGKVFAALCAQTMCLKFDLDCIINTGVAGGLAEGLSILDIVVAESVVQHDMDTSPLGDPVGLLSGINVVNIPCNEDISKALSESIEKVGVKHTTGVIATGDQFISTQEKKDFIKSTFNAVSCEMEGGAIGQVCYVNGMPFGAIRAISDGGNDDAAMDYPAFAAKAAENSIAAVLNFLAIL